MTTWESCVPVSVSSDRLSDDEIASYVRAWRNRELAACDFTQLPDSPVIQGDWAVYRQQLRDLPMQGSNPKLWQFPERP